jgi:hypothetical protein
MPTYEALCNHCATVVEYRCAVVDALRPPWCPECKGAMRKVIRTAPKGFVKGKFEPFKSPVDGTVISTERALRDHNARNNVVNIHDGYPEERVIKGDYMGPPPKPDKKDISKDIYEAARMLEQGYKPEIGVYEDA